MRISNFTGNLKQDWEVYKVVDDEKFLKSHVEINGHCTPIVASEYILKDMAGKRARIQGYLRTESVKANPDDTKERMFTFINASIIEEASEDEPDRCNVRVTGKLWGVKPFYVKPNGCEVLPIIVRYTAPDEQSCIVHVSICGADARKSYGRGLARGSVVMVDGYIKPKGSVVEVIATSFAVKGGDDCA